jgi:hypothetical protein
MWFDIVKTNKTRHFLLEVFNIPYDADITFPQNLLISFQAVSNENLITEQKFNSLLELSNQGKYQEVVDSLDKMLKDAQKQTRRKYRQTPKVKEKNRKYKQKPEYKEQQRKYRQTPEYKEREKQRTQTPEYKEQRRIYQQTPEYKERKRREYYQRKEAGNN